MITEKDLKEAIAKCQGVSKPNETAYILLAAATYLLDRAEQENQSPAALQSYSYAPAPENTVEETVDYYSDTEFSKIIDGKYAADVWEVMDELMTVLQAIQPRLYEGTLRKLREI